LHPYRSRRTHENGLSVFLVDSSRISISVASASSVFLLTALQDIMGTSNRRVELDDVADNVEHESDSVDETDNFSIHREKQQLETLFSVSGSWLQLFHANGTLQWRENLCKIGHFVQIEQNLVGISSVSADLLLQLQAVAQWVLIHCDIVIPVSTDVPGDNRFIHYFNTSHLSDINSSVIALHWAAVHSRMSMNCVEFDYGFDELKKCANSLPQNRTFNSSSLLQIFQPFAISPSVFSVYSADCVEWDILPPAGMRSPFDVHFHVQMWVSCPNTRRVLALSKSAIMLLTAVANATCELKVLFSNRTNPCFFLRRVILLCFSGLPPRRHPERAFYQHRRCTDLHPVLRCRALESGRLPQS
jgi:hypothetical protein